MTPNETLASVIVVSYNSSRHLPRCLRSLEATTGNDCEVLVLDNTSTDGSADLVARDFPWVKLVRLSENTGFAAANNIGARLALGRYVVALNPDTEVTIGWLEALLAPFTQPLSLGERPIGATTARILMMDAPAQVNTCGNIMHLTGITKCRGLGLAADASELSYQAEVSAVSGACFAMLRELWLRFGGFDPGFFTYVEDTDLSLRARLAGYRCVYAPGAVVYHSYTSSFSPRKLYYLERNRTAMLLKCLTWPTLLLLFPVLAVAECIAWGYALKSSPAHVWAKVKAYSWLAANGRRVWRARREAQSHRQVSDRELLRAADWRLDIGQLAGPKLQWAVEALLNPLFRAWHHALTSERVGLPDKGPSVAIENV